MNSFIHIVKENGMGALKIDIHKIIEWAYRFVLAATLFFSMLMCMGTIVKVNNEVIKEATVEKVLNEIDKQLAK